MSIKENIAEIRKHLPENVTLVCVSKYHPSEAISEAYEAGERVFGESKVQELCGKYEELPKDIEWHFIGHLQSNKIKYMAPFVSLIHGVDSFKLLAEINKQAAKADRKIRCLLQVHIAMEDSKFGFDDAELLEMLEAGEWKNLENIQICGLMGMATFTDNTTEVVFEFSHLKTLFDKVKSQFFANDPEFKDISMGMSDDYLLAVEQGSTMVRIGSSIFGHRAYN